MVFRIFLEVAFGPSCPDFLGNRRHLDALHALGFRLELVESGAGHRHIIFHGQSFTNKKSDPAVSGPQ